MNRYYADLKDAYTESFRRAQAPNSTTSAVHSANDIDDGFHTDDDSR